MNKTLIGKHGYLFLQNDSAKELEVHCNNLDITKPYQIRKVLQIKDKYMMTVFPNKSLQCKEYLPDGYFPIYRPAFEKYSAALTNHIIDGYQFLKEKKDEFFYKTDTHINLNGCYIIYRAFVDKINQLFGLSITKKECTIEKMDVLNLQDLQIGLGDLLSEINLADQQLESRVDTYYFSNDIQLLHYKKYIDHDSIRVISHENNALLDVTDKHIGLILDWNIFSKYILNQKNNISNTHKVLIFYDSFLLSTLSLYLSMFGEVYMSKSIIRKDLIDLINPDYIFEFRVERFLL
jgi:hypothetical protein